MTTGTIREPESPRRADEYVELFEDGLRWHRLAQQAVDRMDVTAAQRAYLRRQVIAVEITRRCPDLTTGEVLARIYNLARVEVDSRPICPCGIRFVYGDAIAYSPAWHRAHRRIHLDTFPDVDARTVEILDENIARAESTGDAS